MEDMTKTFRTDISGEDEIYHSHF